MKSLDEIVDSLFSVLVTAGVIPIIRSPRNNAAEMVAQKLDQKLRDHLKVYMKPQNPNDKRANPESFLKYQFMFTI